MTTIVSCLVVFLLIGLSLADDKGYYPQTNPQCPINTFGDCVRRCNPWDAHSCSIGETCCPDQCGGLSCQCPIYRPRVNCFIDPCQFATCYNIPGARCVSDYCGGCNARWFLGYYEVTNYCQRTGHKKHGVY